MTQFLEKQIKELQIQYNKKYASMVWNQELCWFVQVIHRRTEKTLIEDLRFDYLKVILDEYKLVGALDCYLYITFYSVNNPFVSIHEVEETTIKTIVNINLPLDIQGNAVFDFIGSRCEINEVCHIYKDDVVNSIASGKRLKFNISTKTVQDLVSDESKEMLEVK